MLQSGARNFVTLEREIHPCSHSSSIPFFSCTGVCQGSAEASPSCYWTKAGLHSASSLFITSKDKLPFTITHPHTHQTVQTSQFLIYLTCMFLDFGKKLLYRVRTYIDTERTCILHTEKPPIQEPTPLKIQENILLPSPPYSVYRTGLRHGSFCEGCHIMRIKSAKYDADKQELCHGFSVVHQEATFSH